MLVFLIPLSPKRVILVQNQNTLVVEWGKTGLLSPKRVILVQNRINSIVEWGEQGYCIATNSYFGSSSLIHIFLVKVMIWKSEGRKFSKNTILLTNEVICEFWGENCDFGLIVQVWNDRVFSPLQRSQGIKDVEGRILAQLIQMKLIQNHRSPLKIHISLHLWAKYYFY